MVLDAFELLISPYIAFSALVGALSGLIVIATLFKNKIKELFDDTNYFLFFFLAIGYTLYALGELSWHLILKTTGEPDANSIADVYWTAGVLAIFCAFAVFAYTMHRRYGEQQHRSWMILGVGLAFAVLMYLFFIIITATQSYPFGYFYLVMSSLILILSVNILLFRQKIAQMGQGFLLFFFLANVGTFVGDALFLFNITRGVYGLAGVVSSIAYLGSYTLSAIAFITMLIRFYGQKRS